MKVVYEADQQRAAVYDQGQLIGQCVYEDKGDHWIITTTKVDPAYGGQGLGRQLVDAVVAAAGSRASSCGQPAPMLSRFWQSQDMKIYTKKASPLRNFAE